MESASKNCHIPEEFKKIIPDFIQDIQTTFPEYKDKIQTWWQTPEDYHYFDNPIERQKIYNQSLENNLFSLFEFCKEKYPPKFFDILYQNEELFTPKQTTNATKKNKNKNNNENNNKKKSTQTTSSTQPDIFEQADNLENSIDDTEFLPHISFRTLWQYKDISKTTRETIWKYLQLVLFSVIGSVQDKNVFGGDTEKLFESINEDEFKQKLEETINQMQGMFDLSGNMGMGGLEGMGDDNPFMDFVNVPLPSEEEETSGGSGGGSSTSPQMPNANDIHAHINGLLEGKLGKFAKEFAEETARDLNLDLDNDTNAKELFSKLMKNPAKLMGLMKKLGTKFNDKMRSGEFTQKEMMEEVKDMMDKMKQMPGMENMPAMFQNMMGKAGSAGVGGAKINMAAMQQMMKAEELKEKMRQRMMEKQMKKEEKQKEEKTRCTSESFVGKNPISDEELIQFCEKSSTPTPTPTPTKKAKSGGNNDKHKKSKAGKK